MKKQIITATFVAAAALSMTACQNEGTVKQTSVPPTSKAVKTPAAQKTTDAKAPTATKTTTAPAPTAAKANSDIRNFDFKNATWTDSDGVRVKMSGGKAVRTHTEGSMTLERHYTVNPEAAPSIGTKYGDLNDDGYDDALVNFEEAEGNGYLVTTYVWLGGPNGPKQLTNSTLPTSARCGTHVESVTIQKEAGHNFIAIKGAERTGSEACAEMPTDTFDRLYLVDGNRVVQNAG